MGAAPEGEQAPPTGVQVVRATPVGALGGREWKRMERKGSGVVFHSSSNEAFMRLE